MFNITWIERKARHRPDGKEPDIKKHLSPPLKNHKRSLTHPKLALLSLETLAYSNNNLNT